MGSEESSAETSCGFKLQLVRRKRRETTKGIAFLTTVPTLDEEGRVVIATDYATKIGS